LIKNIKRFVFLLLLFIIIILFLWYFNSISKNLIKEKLRDLSYSEAKIIKTLIKETGYHLTNKDEDEIKEFLKSIFKGKDILYIGLLKNNNLNYLLTKFEGFFPYRKSNDIGIKIFSSEIGKILEIRNHYKIKENKFEILIGFDYNLLDFLEKTTQKNFFIVTIIISLMFIILLILFYFFDKKFFEKEVELVNEREEKERFKELSLLTSEIAHEIKNPLNSIYLSFNTLKKHIKNNEESDFYVNAIKEEILRISNIINNYSDLSKDVYPVKEKINLSEFLDNFKIILSNELDEKDIQLNFIVSKEAKEIISDKNLLKQILLNFIKNSIEAKAKRIDLIFEIKEKEIFIKIIDNGIGVDDKLKKNIFKPYISSKTKGMGLGLYINKKLINSLNGDIKLISSKKGHTEFQIWFSEE